MTPLPYTRQQLADALQAWVAMDKDGSWFAYDIEPWIDVDEWWAEDHRSIHSIGVVQITDPPTDWRESLTAPRTEAEPEVCEWRWSPINYWWSTDCGIQQVPAKADQRCRVCRRPIRIVKDDNE